MPFLLNRLAKVINWTIANVDENVEQWQVLHCVIEGITFHLGEQLAGSKVREECAHFRTHHSHSSLLRAVTLERLPRCIHGTLYKNASCSIVCDNRTMQTI